MQPRDWRLFLHDMLQAAAMIQRATQGMTFSEFRANEIVSAGVLYYFIVIGEATTQLPPHVLERSSSIPCAKIRGMRNRLIHAYYETGFGVVWDTATNDLPALRLELERLLGDGAPPASSTSSLQ